MQIKVIPTIQRKSTNLTQPNQKMSNPAFGLSYDEAFKLRDKVTLGDFPFNETNKNMLRQFFVESEEGVRKYLRNIVSKWEKTSEEVFAGLM